MDLSNFPQILSEAEKKIMSQEWGDALFDYSLSSGMGALGILAEEANSTIGQAFKNSLIPYFDNLNSLINERVKGNKKSALLRQVKDLQKRVMRIPSNELGVQLIAYDIGKSGFAYSADVLKDYLGVNKVLFKQINGEFKERMASFVKLRDEFLDIQKAIPRSTLVPNGESTEVKKSNKKSIDGIIGNIQVIQNSIRRLDDKIGKITARIENIERNPEKLDNEEINSIISRLVSIGSSPEISDLIKNQIETLRSRVGALLMRPENAHTSVNTPTQSPIVLETKPDNESLDEGNEEIIRRIETFIENSLGYGLSSTRKEGHRTYGDGSFIKQIFRPFLNSIVVLTLHHKLDLTRTSWKDISGSYFDNIHETDNARRAFVFVLSQSNIVGKFDEIWRELTPLMTNFAQSGYYGNSEKSPLQNVIVALDEF